MQRSRDAVLENADLVTEILLRLPAKHVVRCKCVSKKWLALISNPQFRYSHTLRTCHTSSPCSLLLHKCKCSLKFQIVPLTNSDADPSPVKTYQFDNLIFSPHIIIDSMQSCNGFLFFKASKFILGLRMPRFRPQHYYSIYNPTTNNFLVLEFPSHNFKHEISALYLVFDPLKSPHFKVISFRRVKSDQTSGPNRFKINVYSSENGSWSEDGVCFTASPNMHVDSGVYCDGALHWYTPIEREDSVYFDVHRQCFNTLPEPASIDYNNLHVKYFGESRGHLHLILINSYESLDFDILELKKDYSGWVVRYHVDLNLIGDNAFSQHANPDFSVLCVVRQANEDDAMLVLFVESKILSYNLKDRTSRIIYEVDEVGQSFQYFETLLDVGLSPT